MPIKDLSDRRRLPRLGKIHLGIMVKSNKACKCVDNKDNKPDPNCRVCRGTGFTHYPKETDYFVVPKTIEEVYGAQPKELKIMFPVENSEVFFQQWYKRYGFELLKCMGDGETAMTWDEKEGGMKQIPCPCEELEKGSCTRQGILQFLLPDVPGAGVWQIRTGSKNSIIDVNSSIDYIREICGRIKMIPLILKRVETPTHRIENGNLKKGTHYTLQIDVDNISLRQLQQAAQIAPERILLPPPDPEDTKDELFYPPAGFKPENEEPEEIDEASAIVQKQKELRALIDSYKKSGGTVTAAEIKRQSQFKGLDEYVAEIDSFNSKIAELKKNPNTPQDEIPWPTEPGAQKQA